MDGSSKAGTMHAAHAMMWAPYPNVVAYITSAPVTGCVVQLWPSGPDWVERRLASGAGVALWSVGTILET